MDKKYELSDISITLNDGRKLYRIKALKDFYNVTIGDLGGFVESEENWSQEGECWLDGNSCAYNNAKVSGNAKLYDMTIVSGNSKIYDTAILEDRCYVSGNAEVYEEANLKGDISVVDDAKIHGNVTIVGGQTYSGNADIENNMHHLCLYPMSILLNSEDENTDPKVIVMNFYRSADGKILVTNTLSEDENVTCSPIEDVLAYIRGENNEEIDAGIMETIECLCKIAQSYIKI